MKGIIVILITGQLRFLTKKNYTEIKNSFPDYKLEFSIVPWKNQNFRLIKKFKKIYKPRLYKEIKNIEFKNKLKNIFFTDNEANIENIFFNWYSFSKGLKHINNHYKRKKIKPDYILRYRSDILPKKNIFEIKKFINKSIIIPDRYHWHGINDNLFLFPYSAIKDFSSIMSFINLHIKKKSFFSSEYIFYLFLKNKKYKIFFNNFNYNITRRKNIFTKNINLKKTKQEMKLIDKIITKKNRLFFKFRNFKDYFILKTNRNNKQSIVIN